jgi:hypothetical protein
MLMLILANGMLTMFWRLDMNRYRVRVFLSESNWQDLVLSGDNCWIAEKIGIGMSPIGRARFLGEA